MAAELLMRVRSATRISARLGMIAIEPGRPFLFVAGQAILAGLATQPRRRPYSIACSPATMRRHGVFELLVTLDEDGSFGPHLTPLATGSMVAIQGPVGTFGLPRALTGRSVLCVAGGTGIAPLRAMMQVALERIPPVAIDLVYSARTPADLAFDREFRMLQGAGRIRYWPTVTRQPEGAWPGRRGRIDRECLRAALRPAPVCLVCGPPSFTTEQTDLLLSLGVRRASVRTERY